MVTVSVVRMSIVLFLLLLLTPLVGSEAADQKTSVPQEAPAPAPPPSPVIPLAEAASRATEVEALLRGYRTLQASTPVAAMIEKQLPEATALIGLELERTRRLLREQPMLETLGQKQEFWTRRQLLTTTWLDALTRRVIQLQEALTRLADQQRTWTQTQDAARAAKAPEPVLGQIAEVLAAVEAAQLPLQAQRVAALELQGRVAREVARCQAALFERPIHVGDTIEAGGVTGSVRRIGIRSSVVRTGQGAEIIVPNAQLVTERVTNWTLSDRHRRIELPVGVSYSAHPQRVMEMLEAVARAHPRVLAQPAPRAFLAGFGDNAITFELRAWTDQTDQFDEWFQIRSDLAAAVYDAGHAAGIAFPLSQLEVHLRRDTTAPPAAAPPSGRP